MATRLIDIAIRLNISPTTVSRALNPKKQHLISADVRKKIFQMAEQLGYEGHRPLPTAKRSIGVLLPTMFNSIFFNEQISKYLSGIFNVLLERPDYICKVLVLSKDNGPLNLTRADLTEDMEGLLISSHTPYSSGRSHYYPTQLLQLWGRPVVAFNLEIERSKNINVVAFSNFEAAQKALSHLITKKRRRIAFIQGNKDHEDAKSRYQAYVQTLRNHSIPLDKSLIKKGAYSHQSGYEMTRELFAGNNTRPNGIFCANDEMAIGSLRALKSLNIRCPEEVAVMGFDGLTLGEFVQPRLSTVAQPLEEIAREGTNLLIDLIEKRIQGPQFKLIPSRLIIRESA